MSVSKYPIKRLSLLYFNIRNYHCQIDCNRLFKVIPYIATNVWELGLLEAIVSDIQFMAYFCKQDPNSNSLRWFISHTVAAKSETTSENDSILYFSQIQYNIFHYKLYNQHNNLSENFNLLRIS